jgi:hypothetical protein
MPKYKYDDEIDENFASLSSAEKMIGKEFELMKQKAKDEAAKEEKANKEEKSAEKKKDATADKK